MPKVQTWVNAWTIKCERKIKSDTSPISVQIQSESASVNAPLDEKDVPGVYFPKDPATYSVSELQRWLQCHGQKNTGREQELIHRVRGCITDVLL